MIDPYACRKKSRKTVTGVFNQLFINKVNEEFNPYRISIVGQYGNSLKVLYLVEEDTVISNYKSLEQENIDRILIEQKDEAIVEHEVNYWKIISLCLFLILVVIGVIVLKNQRPPKNN